MADLKKLPAQKREAFGKGNNRRLRAKGVVPAVFYTRDGKNLPIQVSLKELNKMFETVGRTTVFNLDVAGEGQFPALFWQAMRDPCKGTFTHVDFYGVDLDRPVKVVVPLVFEGTARGTKVGGVLETYRDEVTLMAKPLDMPASLVVDVTELEINNSLQISDLKLPEGVSAVYDINYAVVSVLPPNSADKDESGEEGAAEAKA